MPELVTGQRFPDTPHAVSVQLATLQDVLRLEEGDPSLQLDGSYPRFAAVPYVSQALTHLRQELPAERAATIVASTRAAEDMIAKLNLGNADIVEDGGLSVVTYARSNVKARLILEFTKIIGSNASSRRAEDYLYAHGELDTLQPEVTIPDRPGTVIMNYLANLYPTSNPTRAGVDVLLANTGMGSVYGVLRAMGDIHPEKNIWIQLGGVYSDTATALAEYGGVVRTIYDIHDFKKLTHELETGGSNVAGVFTEAPTNPLVQATDFVRLKSILDTNKTEVPLVVDVSGAGSAAVDVLPYADVILESLTKFASGHGDVMMGAIIVNPASPLFKDLQEACPLYVDVPYERDLARLAHTIQGYRQRIKRIGANTLVLADFFETQPGIDAAHWSGSPKNADNFATIARDKHAPSGLITVVPTAGLQSFYDAIEGPKGPSFGMERTLHTPYTWLAHFALIGTEFGGALLAKMGLDQNMLRISVGLDDPAELKDMYSRALRR